MIEFCCMNAACEKTRFSISSSVLLMKYFSFIVMLGFHVSSVQFGTCRCCAGVVQGVKSL